MQANGRNSVEALTLRASQLFKDEPVTCGKVLAAIVKLREDSARALLEVDDHAVLEVALKDLAQPNEGAALMQLGHGWVLCWLSPLREILPDPLLMVHLHIL